MAIATELRQALEEGRDELVSVMAAYEVVPVESEAQQATADFLGGGGDTTDFSLKQWGSDETLADRQTRKFIVEKLGVDTVEDCEAVQEEIQNHDEWGAET